MLMFQFEHGHLVVPIGPFTIHSCSLRLRQLSLSSEWLKDVEGHYSKQAKPSTSSFVVDWH